MHLVNTEILDSVEQPLSHHSELFCHLLTPYSFYFALAGASFVMIQSSLWFPQISPPTRPSCASKRRRSLGFRPTTSTTSTTWSSSGCLSIRSTRSVSTASGVFTTWTSSGWTATPSPAFPGSLWPTCQTWGSLIYTTTKSLPSLSRPPGTSKTSPIWTYPVTV